MTPEILKQVFETNFFAVVALTASAPAADSRYGRRGLGTGGVGGEIVDILRARDLPVWVFVRTDDDQQRHFARPEPRSS